MKEEPRCARVGQKIPDWLKIQFSVVQAGVLTTLIQLVCECHSKSFAFVTCHITWWRNVGVVEPDAIVQTRNTTSYCLLPLLPEIKTVLKKCFT